MAGRADVDGTETWQEVTHCVVVFFCVAIVAVLLSGPLALVRLR